MLKTDVRRQQIDRISIEKRARVDQSVFHKVISKLNAVRELKLTYYLISGGLVNTSRLVFTGPLPVRALRFSIK